MNGSIADKYNFEPKHEHGFYEDGSGNNTGLFKEGLKRKEDIHKYKLEDKHYDDKRMGRVQKSVDPGKYNLIGIGGVKNNCQDYADKMRERYKLLWRGDNMR